MDKKKLEELSKDHEKWDEGELGQSKDHIAFLSDEEEQEIDEGLGLQQISIRLPKALIEQLKGLAKLEGIGYQPLVRHVLIEYARENEYKLDALLSDKESMERADRLLARAVELRAEIPSMRKLSSEKLSAETNYTKWLTQAQSLFTQAFDSRNAIIKQHAKRRMAEIADLCQQDLKADQDQNYSQPS